MPLGASDAGPYIAAGAAVLGALVGGAASGLATYKVEQLRHRNEETRRNSQDLELARGLARVLQDDLDRASAQLRLEQDHRGLDPFYGEKPQLPTEERTILYRHLSANEFSAVKGAIATMEVIAQTRELAASGDAETADRMFAQWTESDQALRYLKAGTDALGRLSSGDVKE